MNRYVDRSRSLSWQGCPRRRFWNYEAYGRGVQPIKMSIPLVVGQCVHSGLAGLLKAAQEVGFYPDDCPRVIDEAVGVALEEYDKEVRARGLVLDEVEEAATVFDEQKALIEAMIRVWALRRLPGFLEQFEVLEVEREDQFELTSVDGPTTSATEIKGLYKVEQYPEKVPIVWMSRADGLLRERATGDLYVLSFKTASDWSGFKDKEARIDMQGMSELYAIEERIAREDERDYGALVQNHQKLAGVQMEFLIKGRRAKDKETGAYVQDSYLVRPWMRDGVTSEFDEYAWSYWSHCEEPHTTSGGKKCPGDANHSLGKGWRRVAIWERMSVKEWIQLLHEGGVQSDAGDPLAGLIVSPMPYYRHEDEIQDWREQMEGQEARIAEAVQAKEHWSKEKDYLNLHWPQHRESCFKYGEKHPCSYLSVCFENIGDPLASGLFQLRAPHHLAEKEAFDA